MLGEPKAVLVDVSWNALKKLLAVGIGFVNLNALWLEEVVAFVPNSPQEDVPNAEDVVAVPKTEPVVVEDEGCTAALEIPVAVVSGTWVFQGEGFVPNSPPVVEEDRDSAVPVKETAFVPKGLADGALELLLLGLPSFVSNKPFADGALVVGLLK